MPERVNIGRISPTCYPVRVFCRVLPLSPQHDPGCVKVKNSTSIILTTPTHLVENHKAKLQRETHHVFKHVFEPEATQLDVFATTAQPLVQDLIHGQNSLLLTYGITGSGKTHTMTGNIEHRGILPRCLDLVFRTITDLQTARFVFKPDRRNGFVVQSFEAALKERMQPAPKHSRRHNHHKSRAGHWLSSATETNALPSDSDESLSILQLDKDNMYAVFITYIEVYNNVVYDLLEESSAKKRLQPKIIYEDRQHNTMFVPGATEVEVKSADEAAQVFQRGQDRKRMAETILNVESSRSHTVFNIRLVQAPFDQQGGCVQGGRKNITISQLSLVDLAGSERCCRSKCSGMHLREAGNINNSLVTLCSCLKFLRANQKAQPGSPPKNIPYRQSKITHLFKKFFDGGGQMSMIVCINPGAENYAENMQVMEFAEMSQKIEITRVKRKKRAVNKSEMNADNHKCVCDGEVKDLNYEFPENMDEKLMPYMWGHSKGPEALKQLYAYLNMQLMKAIEENRILHENLSSLHSQYANDRKRVTRMKEIMHVQQLRVNKLNNRLGRNKRKMKQKNEELRQSTNANKEQRRQYHLHVKDVIDTINLELKNSPQTPCPICKSVEVLDEDDLSARSAAASSDCSCCTTGRGADVQVKYRPRTRFIFPNRTPRYNVRYGNCPTRCPQPNDLQIPPNIKELYMGSTETKEYLKAIVALCQWCNDE